MHYQINGQEVRSERAAKSVLQPNAYVLAWISSLPSESVVLDYGCGRLRYTIPLSRLVKQVVAVDSTYQVDKLQTIAGEHTTVRRYAQDRLPNVLCNDTDDQQWKSVVCDYAICTNVLSAIPHRDGRLEILRIVASQVVNDGLVLVSTQYRDASFTKCRVSGRAYDYRDGFVVPDPCVAGCCTFYGLINRQSLRQHCEDAGLSVLRDYRVDKSAYVECWGAQNVK